MKKKTRRLIFSSAVLALVSVYGLLVLFELSFVPQGGFFILVTIASAVGLISFVGLLESVFHRAFSPTKSFRAFLSLVGAFTVFVAHRDAVAAINSIFHVDSSALPLTSTTATALEIMKMLYIPLKYVLYLSIVSMALYIVLAFTCSKPATVPSYLTLHARRGFLFYLRIYLRKVFPRKEIIQKSPSPRIIGALRSMLLKVSSILHGADSAMLSYRQFYLRAWIAGSYVLSAWCAISIIGAQLNNQRRFEKILYAISLATDFNSKFNCAGISQSEYNVVFLGPEQRRVLYTKPPPKFDLTEENIASLDNLLVPPDFYVMECVSSPDLGRQPSFSTSAEKAIDN